MIERTAQKRSKSEVLSREDYERIGLSNNTIANFVQGLRLKVAEYKEQVTL